MSLSDTMLASELVDICLHKHGLRRKFGVVSINYDLVIIYNNCEIFVQHMTADTFRLI